MGLSSGGEWVDVPLEGSMPLSFFCYIGNMWLKQHIINTHHLVWLP